MPLSPPLASMGFVGYVRFITPTGTVQVRATSSDIRLSQEITKPDVIDGRFDRTVYQLGPKIVEGSVDYPAIMGDVGSGIDPTATLYTLAAKRNVPGDGKLTSAEIVVSYTNDNASFRYRECIINEWTYNIAQSEAVSVNVSIIGLEREATTFESMTEGNTFFPNQSRIVTWNDAVVRVFNGTQFDIGGENIRTFSATYNNNAERFYTLNGKLFPQDVAPRKRDITGSIVFMGRLPRIADHALTNEDRCNEVSSLTFGHRLTNVECTGTFVVTLPNVVYEIEELALTNDLFETTVNWHCLPNALDLTSSDILDTG